MERRHIVGGASVTEEIVPGYKFSRASYILSLLRPKILKDLELKKHGLKVYLRDPSSYTPLKKEHWKGDVRSLTLGMNHDENKRQIAQFSEKDAKNFALYEEQLTRFVAAIDKLLDTSPPDMSVSFFNKHFLKPTKTLASAGLSLSSKDVASFYEMLTGPTTKILDKWFESEPLKATLATDACIGAMISPSSPGSGYVLIHHVMGELDGIKGAWGYPEGGMGGVSNAIARSAIESGAEIVTNAEVKKIVTNYSGVEGVELSDGMVIKAAKVLSNATPHKTFLEMIDSNAIPDEYIESIKRIDYKSPVTKINVAVNQLPNFLATPNREAGKMMPHHRCTIHMNCENSQLLEDAYNNVLRGSGIYSKKPMIEMTIPSSLDPTLAPKDHHVCLFFTQYTPYDLAGGWNEEAKEKYANLIFDTVDEYAPGFKASIVGKEVLSPPVLEETFGLTGGNIFHGAMSLDQLFLARPIADSQGRVAPTTPINGLYICGSGAHPGGGVMGSPGRLAAARAVLDMSGVKWKFN